MNDISLSMETDAFALETLLRSIYKSPDIACVRELIRNAIDSHIDSHIDRKVDVGFTDSFFYLRDYGAGITPSQLSDLVSVLMRSNKRHEDSKSTGGYGLGSKTVFGILYNDLKNGNKQSSIIMESVAEGVKSIYHLTLDEHGAPTYKLLQRGVSDDHSGVSYYIELSSSMRNMNDKQLLTIFAPILDDINFVNEDLNNFIEIVTMGNMKIAIRKNPLDEDGLPIKSSIFNQLNVCEEKTSFTISRHVRIDNALNIQYANMIYPMPDGIQHFYNDNSTLLDYAERYINFNRDISEYSYSNSDFIIIHDIGFESFNMEPTRSRDSLIIENIDLVGLRNHIDSSMLKESYEHYTVTCVYSTLSLFKEYCASNNLSKSPIINEHIINTNDIKVMMSVITAYIIDNDFFEYVSTHGVTNKLVKRFEYAPLELSFNTKDVIRCFATDSIYSGDFIPSMDDSFTLADELKVMIIDAFSKIIENITGTIITTSFDDLTKYYRSHGYGNNYHRVKNTASLLVRLSQHNIDDLRNDLNLSTSISVNEDDKVVRDAYLRNIFLFSPESNIDDYVILYKDGKLNNNKVEQFAKDNKDKIVLVIDKDGNPTSKSRVIDMEQLTVYACQNPTLLIGLIKYHQHYPITTLSSALSSYKTIKAKAAPKVINVPNDKAVARAVTIHAKDINNLNPTYKDIIELVDSHSTIYLRDDLETIENSIHINKNYYSYFYINYNFSFYSDNVGLYISTKFNDVYVSGGKFRSTSLPYDDFAVIHLGKNASNAIVEYLNNNHKVVDYTVFTDKVIKDIETNDFKLKNDNKVDESSKDVIIDIYSILYAKQKLKKLLSTCNNFSGYSYNRNDVFLHMSKWILERHITDTNLFELNTIKDETISDVIHYMNPNEIYDVILQVDIERQKIDAILDAYSNAELEFISMIFNVVKAYNDKDDDFVVKFKTKVTEMEQLHKL